MGGAWFCWREGAARAVWVSAGGETVTHGSSATLFTVVEVNLGLKNKSDGKLTDKCLSLKLIVDFSLKVSVCSLKRRLLEVTSTEEPKADSREHVEAATYLVVRSNRQRPLPTELLRLMQGEYFKK